MSQLDRMERLLWAIYRGEIILMSIADDELAEIQKQGTTIDSIHSLLDIWVANGTISPAQSQAIKDAFAANDAKLALLEAAL